MPFSFVPFVVASITCVIGMIAVGFYHLHTSKDDEIIELVMDVPYQDIDHYDKPKGTSCH